MAKFIIEGGHALHGDITPQGAKNEALEVICASLLTSEEVTISNVPDILDINNLIRLLQDIGVKVRVGDEDGCQRPLAPYSLRGGVNNGNGRTFTFQADELDLDYLSSDEFVRKCAQLRGSVLMIGPLLGRFGKATVAKPGGDKIGRRRLDTHFLGFHKLGASYTKVPGRDVYELTAGKNDNGNDNVNDNGNGNDNANNNNGVRRFPRRNDSRSGLKGCYMLLDEASVTGTANIIMAAVMAEGTTTIYKAACEPYIQQLCHMLNRMGANISGIGSNLITIIGVERLHGTSHRLLPDMIEVGSFIAMAAMVGNGIRIKDASIRNLGIIPDAFRRLGITIEEEGDDLYIPHHDTYQIDSFIDGTIMTLSDAPWPGLTPDLLSVLLVVATQAQGSVLFHQKMFESRLFFVDKLIDMGAQIILCDPHRAVVVGHDHKIRLRAARMSSPDIRAGIALLIAALSADGTSEISNIAQIDRGYQNIEARLNALGAKITRDER